MTNQGPSNQGSEEESEDTDANRLKQSRRSLLAAMGVGAAGLALGGVTNTASASEESSPAAEFIDSTSPATTATSDGDWSDSAVWDNGVPTAEQTVRIESGVTVTVDTTTERIKNLDVAGTLTFARDTDTHLRAETVVTRPDSSLEIGTESNPIPSDTEARITFVDHEDISEKDHDPERISKGLIVMGDVAINGAEKTTWDELATAPTAGDTSIELPEAPTNWQEGDDIAIPGVHPTTNEHRNETRTISSISGTTVSFDEPLEYDHVPPENNLDRELTSYVLNLSRNVVMQSDPDIDVEGPTDEQSINRQGHVMIMTPATSVNYARLRRLGRTNKFYHPSVDFQGNEAHTEASAPNPRARYSFHYHETGIDEDPHEAEGLVVQDNPGWGVVNHHSHANVRDSITYRCLGAGFASEAGDERGMWKRCFALESHGVGDKKLDGRDDDFGYQGHGFWFQGPAVAMEDCVAASHRQYGFATWTHPILDGGTVQNEEPIFPAELAREDGILGAAESYVEDGFVPIQRLQFRSFTNCTVFSSAGGFQHGGIHKPPRWDGSWATIESFTAYSNGSFIPEPRGNPFYQEGGGRGNEGATGINGHRYAGALRVVDAQIYSKDGLYPKGITMSTYYRGLTVEDSTIESQVGMWLVNRSRHYLRNIEFDCNHPVLNSHRRKEGGLEMESLTPIAEGDDTSGQDFHIKSAVTKHGGGVGAHENLNQLFNDNHDTLDGREIYYPIQDPDFVPFESEGDIPGGNLSNVVGADDRSALVGKTNQELQDEFGTSVYSEVTPDEAVNIPYLWPGKARPLVQPRRPDEGTEVTFDASAVADTDSATSYEWELGDGTTLSGESPTHSFDSSGIHDVTLTVTDGSGNTDVTETYIKVQRTADADQRVLDVIDPDEGNGYDKEYELSVTGELQPTDWVENHDTVDESTAIGKIDGDRDRYFFTGEVEYFGGLWNVDLRIDGEDVDPGEATQKQHILLYENENQGKQYEFTVSGDIERGALTEHTSRVNGSTASGNVHRPQHNSYIYTGEITDLSTSGNGALSYYINGEQVANPASNPEPESEPETGSASETTQSPYNRDSGWPVPGRVQAEDYDEGGSGVAFSDQSADNTGGAYRDDQVDIQASGDGYNVGWMAADEWLEYTVDVESAGTYDVVLRMATPRSGTALGVEIDGQDRGTVDVPQTGGWDSFTTVTLSGVDLDAGEQVVRLSVADTGGQTFAYDLDWFEISESGDESESDDESIHAAIDEDDDGEIDDDEIDAALDYWENEEPVPGTGGETISDQEVMDLIDQWNDGDD